MTYLTPEDATLAGCYDQYTDGSALAELAAEEAAAWVALTDTAGDGCELDLNDYEAQQALCLGWHHRPARDHRRKARPAALLRPSTPPA